MKKIKLLVAALLLVVAGTFLFTNDNLFKADIAEDAIIEKGVFIGGVDVGGMTAEEATSAVNNYVESLKSESITLVGPKGNMELTLEEMGLTANTSAAVQEAVSVGRSGNLIKRFKSLQDLESQTLVVDMGLSIDKQATAQQIYNNTDSINIKAIDNGLKRENGTFVYVPGQTGNEVDIVTAVNELNAHIGTEWEVAAIDNAEFTLTSIVSQPRGTEEELAKVQDLMGSFTTNYSTSGWGRAKNVENGASKINGTILYPGDELSVYELVNPFTKENGYELAGSYLNGETVESFGGGICQVSTTLYNAALEAELEITMRFNHSMIVTYVDPAADAAIAGTYKDLRFKNPYDTPVYIEGVCAGRNITFNIYGVDTRDENRTVSYVSETVSVNDPATEFTFAGDQPLGTFIQTRSKHIGYTANLWKIVSVDGVQTEKTQVNKSTYNASCRKVTIGTMGATPEQIAAIEAAIATGDDDQVQAVVEGFAAPPVEDPNAGTTTTPEQGTTDPNAGTTTDPNAGTTTDPNAGTTTDPNAGAGTN